MAPKDDQGRARQQSARDFRGLSSEVSKLGGTMKSYESINSADDEFGDGDRVMIGFTIGMRGFISRNDARIAAKTWRKLCEKYPKAFFALSVHNRRRMKPNLSIFQDYAAR